MDGNRVEELYEATELYYNYMHNRDLRWKMDEILEEYDEDAQMTVAQIFNIMSPEDQQTIIDLASQVAIPVGFGEPGYAKQLYNECINRTDDDDADYDAGIIDFYNALKAEGYIDFD